DDDVLRLGLPHRSERLRRGGVRRAVELPRGGRGRDHRRPSRILRLVLGQRVQGGHRLYLHPAGAVVALVSAWRARGRRMITRNPFFLAFVVLMAALPALPVPEFWITQLNYIGLYALVVIGLVLLTGVVGLTSFGQAAFVGIGAYTAAYLAVAQGWSPWLTLPMGLVLTAIGALVLGWVTLRMSGHFLPLATIAWGLSLFYLLGNIDALGKYAGLLCVPAIGFGGVLLNTGRSLYCLLWALVILAALLVIHLLDSRPGRAL